MAQAYEDPTLLGPNEEESIKCYKKSANNEYPPALFTLAVKYLNGKGVEKDATQKKNLMKKSIGYWKVHYDEGLDFEHSGNLNITKSVYADAAKKSDARACLRFAAAAGENENAAAISSRVGEIPSSSICFLMKPSISSCLALSFFTSLRISRRRDPPWSSSPHSHRCRSICT